MFLPAPAWTPALVIAVLCGAFAASAPVGRGTEPESGFEKPAAIRFGATVIEMQQSLRDACRALDTRTINPPFLPDVEREQKQIDCDGLEFRGEPRWAEFVFRDNSLVMVWILTSGEEESEILKAMTVAYGQPTHRNDHYVAFVDDLAALRRDKPEVLFYSAALAEVYGDWFDEQVGSVGDE